MERGLLGKMLFFIATGIYTQMGETYWTVTMLYAPPLARVLHGECLSICYHLKPSSIFS